MEGPNELIVGIGLTAAGLSMDNDRDKQLILGALGLGLIVGVTLPFSRSNEAEADQIGLAASPSSGPWGRSIRDPSPSITRPTT